MVRVYLLTFIIYLSVSLNILAQDQQHFEHETGIPLKYLRFSPLDSPQYSFKGKGIYYHGKLSHPNVIHSIIVSTKVPLPIRHYTGHERFNSDRFWCYLDWIAISIHNRSNKMLLFRARSSSNDSGWSDWITINQKDKIVLGRINLYKSTFHIQEIEILYEGFPANKEPKFIIESEIGVIASRTKIES